MTAVTTFGTKSLAPKLNFFLASWYCQKQLKTKVLITNGVILIFKSLLEEHTLKQSLSFKANHNCLD